MFPLCIAQDWLVVFTKRDAQKGADFVDQMKKICPSIGIQIRDPKIITLNDDRTETYVKVGIESEYHPIASASSSWELKLKDDFLHIVKSVVYCQHPLIVII